MTKQEKECIEDLPYSLSDEMEKVIDFLLWKNDIELPRRFLEEIRDEIYFTSKKLIKQL